MNENTDQIRLETIKKLQQTLAELESGDELSHFVAGHGFQSRFFGFEWADDFLSITIHLPYGHLLDDAQTQQMSDLSLGIAIRMVILLLTAQSSGEGRLEVICNENETYYAIKDGAGNVVDSGNELNPLVKRLERFFAETDDKSVVIWP